MCVCVCVCVCVCWGDGLRGYWTKAFCAIFFLVNLRQIYFPVFQSILLYIFGVQMFFCRVRSRTFILHILPLPVSFPIHPIHPIPTHPPHHHHLHPFATRSYDRAKYKNKFYKNDDAEFYRTLKQDSPRLKMKGFNADCC